MEKFFELPVDTATICLIDLKFLEDRCNITTNDLEKDNSFNLKIFEIIEAKGTFECSVNAKVEKNVRDTKILSFENGFFLGDPCYAFNSKNWLKLLEDTNYFRAVPKDMPILAVDTGADGLAHVNIKLRKLN